jgi:hypothetical protein
MEADSLLRLGTGVSAFTIGGDWTMAATAAVATGTASANDSGVLEARVWGNAALADVEVAGNLLLLIQGNLTRTATTDTAYLQADSLQLRVLGDAGEASNAMIYSTNRFDARVDGLFRAVELDDLNLGRYGIRLDSAEGQELQVEVRGDGTIAKVLTEGGELVDNGSGTLVLRADAEDLEVRAVVRGATNANLEVRSVSGSLYLGSTIVTTGTGSLTVEALQGETIVIVDGTSLRAGTGGFSLTARDTVNVNRVFSDSTLEVESTAGYVGGIKFTSIPNLVITQGDALGVVRASTGASLLGESPIRQMRLILTDDEGNEYLNRLFGQVFYNNTASWLRGGTFP